MPLQGYDWTQDPMASTSGGRRRKRQRGSLVGTVASEGGMTVPAQTATAFSAGPSMGSFSPTPSQATMGAPASTGKVQTASPATAGPIWGSGGIEGPLGDVKSWGQEFLGSPGNGPAIWGQLTGTGSMGTAASYFGSRFDPRTMLIAQGMGGTDITNQDIMDMGAQMAQLMLGGPGGMMLNPTRMIQNILSTAAKMTENALIGGNAQGPLAALATQDPYTQINTITSLLQGALQSVFPSDVLAGFIEMVKRVAGTWADSMLYEDAGSKPKENIATYLLEHLGPTLGVNNMGPGGRAFDSGQLKAGFSG